MGSGTPRVRFCSRSRLLSTAGEGPRARSLVWYGRFEPATGALIQGQWLLTRLTDGSGNSIRIRGIDAAADGTIAIAGDTAFAIQVVPRGDLGVDSADLAAWRGAYGPSRAGDADGDGDTDGNDFLLWQRQVGLDLSGSATAAPEAYSPRAASGTPTAASG